MISICCGEGNRFYRALTAHGIQAHRSETIDLAVRSATDGGCLLVLADTYPVPDTVITDAHLATAKAKKLTLYVEYPKRIGDNTPGTSPGEMVSERCVISSSYFMPYLEPDTIIVPHGCWYVELENLGQVHIAAAKIAGYRRAVFGLSDVDTIPILAELSDPKILMAATPLSNCIVGRYAPHTGWRDMWRSLLTRFTEETNAATFDWEPTVRPRYHGGYELPDVEHRSSRQAETST